MEQATEPIAMATPMTPMCRAVTAAPRQEHRPKTPRGEVPKTRHRSPRIHLKMTMTPLPVSALRVKTGRLRATRGSRRGCRRCSRGGRRGCARGCARRRHRGRNCCVAAAGWLLLLPTCVDSGGRRRRRGQWRCPDRRGERWCRPRRRRGSPRGGSPRARPSCIDAQRPRFTRW